MRILGVITTLVIAGGMVLGIAIGVTSIPDIKRYLRIRSM